MNICCVKYIVGTMLLMFDVKAFLEILVSTLCLFCCLPVVCRSTLLNETDVALEADGLGSVSLIVNTSFNVSNAQLFYMSKTYRISKR